MSGNVLNRKGRAPQVCISIDPIDPYYVSYGYGWIFHSEEDLAEQIYDELCAAAERASKEIAAEAFPLVRDWQDKRRQYAEGGDA